MSYNNVSLNINQIKSDKEKLPNFNGFLKNLEQFKSMGKSLEQDSRQNCLQKNKINLSKYLKVEGSKSLSFNSTNSLATNDDLNVNLDNVKIIMDNLEFISGNSKYINNIQHQHIHIPRNYNKNNLLPSTNISQKNLFFINKNNNNINNTNINPNNINNNNLLNEIISKSNINNTNYPNENIIKNFDINKFLQINAETKQLPKIEKINESFINEDLNLNLKSTSSSLYRQDYYVKQFKVQYSIWLRNYLNNKLKLLIAETKNCRKHLKFYPLNSLKFTANPKYEDNKYFLSLKIKEILTVGIDSLKSSNQKKNKENIDIIENIIYKQHENANPDLLNFLNCTMEDSIKIFYKSEQFQIFKNSEQTKMNDSKFVQEKNFSLLEDNGFVYLIKNYKGNSKSSLPFSNT